MASEITIDTSQVDRRLKIIADGLKDFSDPLDKTGDDLLDLYGDDNFAQSGSALGEKWKALSVLTLRARAARTGHYAQSAKTSNKILVWTGALQGGFRKQVEATQLTIDNTVSYFKFNQKTRTMLKITDDVTKIATDHIQDYLNDLATK